MGMHHILQHLDRPGNYARILFVDFSSAFNTIIPDLLQTKLMKISVPTPICQWITNFLTDRQQQVRFGKLTSGSLTISTGASQGCVLSSLLFSLYTNDCTATDPSVTLHKFADDTTVIGLISDVDESVYRQEVEQLAGWFSLNNLELNTLKTVEMVVDFRRNPPALPPLTIMNSTVATVESFRFLGSTIAQDLNLFKKHPETQELFPNLKDIKQHELAQNNAVNEHGETVLKKLSELIKAKGQHADILEQWATTDAKQNKIKEDNFQIIADVFTENGILNEARRESLRRVLNAVINDIGCFYKDLGFDG
ncbi:hypothetical protein QTP70_022468 [Hemibagrus guttatus]|uniref:Nitrite reductase MB n=1 Tax=Hemibagrus guttatus TaxID=175788 RepID=A0AAE0PZD8_9TELE|nr:hypothetical protein QTP70_022468 [Hemibagrus guttatus]